MFHQSLSFIYNYNVLKFLFQPFPLESTIFYLSLWQSWSFVLTGFRTLKLMYVLSRWLNAVAAKAQKKEKKSWFIDIRRVRGRQVLRESPRTRGGAVRGWRWKRVLIRSDPLIKFSPPKEVRLCFRHSVNYKPNIVSGRLSQLESVLKCLACLSIPLTEEFHHIFLTIRLTSL